MTQCTHVVLGAMGSGASGSSTTRARLLLRAGTPDQARGGETFSPSHVYFRGIAPPSLKVHDVSDMAIEAPRLSCAAAGWRPSLTSDAAIASMIATRKVAAGRMTSEEKAGCGT